MNVTTVLITGGHSGIGLAAARVLAAENIGLVLAGRSPDRMRRSLTNCARRTAWR